MSSEEFPAHVELCPVPTTGRVCRCRRAACHSLSTCKLRLQPTRLSRNAMSGAHVESGTTRYRPISTFNDAMTVGAFETTDWDETDVACGGVQECGEGLRDRLVNKTVGSSLRARASHAMPWTDVAEWRCFSGDHRGQLPGLHCSRLHG
eukprot:3640498-Rhodomonas_salina.7